MDRQDGDDEIDEAVPVVPAVSVPTCETCARREKVTMLVKADYARRDVYMFVNDKQQIVTRTNIADPNSTQVLFSWIIVPNNNFMAIKLQNSANKAVGIERFINGEPLSLQLQDSGDDHNILIYVMRPRPNAGNATTYISLCFKSRDNKTYYILPSEAPNEPLKIHNVDQLDTQRNVYVFKTVQRKCICMF